MIVEAPKYGASRRAAEISAPRLAAPTAKAITRITPICAGRANGTSAGSAGAAAWGSGVARAEIASARMADAQPPAGGDRNPVGPVDLQHLPRVGERSEDGQHFPGGGFDHLARIAHVDEAPVERVLKPAVLAAVIRARALVPVPPLDRDDAELGGRDAGRDPR